MDISLWGSLWVTLVQVTIALFLSTSIGLFLGLASIKSHQSIEVFKKIFQFLAYFTAIIPTILLLLVNFKFPIFSTGVFLCSIWFVALYTTIGIQKVKQNRNQWYLIIPSISLGMRIGLLLSWSTLQIDSLNSQAGVSLFLWDAYNSGNSGSTVFGLLGLAILAFLLDQLIDMLGIFLSKNLKSHYNGN